jgi:hypothetical protein
MDDPRARKGKAYAGYSLALAVGSVIGYVWCLVLGFHYHRLQVLHFTRGAPPPPPWLSSGLVECVAAMSLISVVGSLVLASLAAASEVKGLGWVVLLSEVLLFLYLFVFFPVF